MLCQLVFLVLLSSLQPARLQEEGTDDSSVFQNINNNIVNLNSLIRSHIRWSEQFRGQMEESMSTLRADLSSLNDSVSNLSVCLQGHKQQTAAELAQLQTYVEQLPVHTCGGTGGWRRVVYLDMTDPSATCPSGWNMTGYSKRTCGRATDGRYTCDSVTFPVSGGGYSRVCGRIRAYQWGSTDAFWSYRRGYRTIDDAYVDGISVTHSSPQQHIWTFASGAAERSPSYHAVCPCDTGHTVPMPSFVGNDYFCESGVNEPWGGSRHLTLHSNDTLWDGENCLSSSTCCSLHNPPYFVKQLPTTTTDDIEARICLSGQLWDENIAVELLELYVQ